jgi:solute carrier family 6 (neurotransmitter transporter, glycine) member 5/9
MLFVLGIGSNVAMMSCIMTVIRDEFTKVKHWQGEGYHFQFTSKCLLNGFFVVLIAALVVAIIGFCIGTVYVTPVSIKIT